MPDPPVPERINRSNRLEPFEPKVFELVHVEKWSLDKAAKFMYELIEPYFDANGIHICIT